MNKYTRTFACGLLLSSLAGCGSDTAPPSNVIPTANAGTDLNVPELSIVSLTGLGEDSDGAITNYQWEQISGPSIMLNTPQSATTSFTAPTFLESEDTIVLALTVTDDQGETATDEVTITVSNVPVEGAISGVEQGLTTNTIELEAALTGAEPFTYEWRQISGPLATTANTDARTMQVSLPAVEEEQTLIFSLTVVDSSQDTNTFEHAITVQPSIPTSIVSIAVPELVTQSLTHDIDKDGKQDVLQLVDGQHIVVQHIGETSTETVDIIRNLPINIASLATWDIHQDGDTDFFMLDDENNIAILMQTQDEYSFIVGGDSGVTNTLLQECRSSEFESTEWTLNSNDLGGLLVSCIKEGDFGREPIDIFFQVTDNGLEERVIELERSPLHENHRLLANGHFVDMDGDGNTDYVPVDQSKFEFSFNPNDRTGRPLYMKGNGSGAFEETATLPDTFVSCTDEHQACIIHDITDLNEDGILDFVYTSRENANGESFGHAQISQDNGNYNESVLGQDIRNDHFGIEGLWMASKATDYNQDGLKDLASCNLDQCTIFINNGTELSETIVLDHRFDFNPTPLFTEIGGDTTPIAYFLEQGEVHFASLNTNDQGGYAYQFSPDTLTPLNQRQAPISTCQFFGQSGACIDNISVRIFKNGPDGWTNNKVSARGYGSFFSQQFDFVYDDFDGDGIRDIRYYSFTINESLFASSHVDSLLTSSNDFQLTPNSFGIPLDESFTPILDFTSHEDVNYVAVDIDDDAQKEVFQYDRISFENTFQLIDNVVNDTSFEHVPLLQDNGAGTEPLAFKGDLEALRVGDEVMVFVGDGNQLKRFRLDTSGSEKTLLLEQSMSIEVPSSSPEQNLLQNNFYANAQILSLHDLDGDGQLEIVFEHLQDDVFRLYKFPLSQGILAEPELIWSTSPASERFSANYISSIKYEDIDLDGDLDLLKVTRNKSEIYLQTSHQTFELFQTLPRVISSFTDVDGDLDPDFVFVEGRNGTLPLGSLHYYQNNIK